MQTTRIAKGPPLDGDRGFKGRMRSARPDKSQVQKPSTYTVMVNRIATLRDISFPAAMIAVRGLVRDIQGHVFAPLKDHHKMVHPGNLETLPPGEHTLNVGPYTIQIRRYTEPKEDESDTGELRCGCIDVCRSNCDGCSSRW